MFWCFFSNLVYRLISFFIQRMYDRCNYFCSKVNVHQLKHTLFPPLLNLLNKHNFFSLSFSLMSVKKTKCGSWVIEVAGFIECSFSTYSYFNSSYSGPKDIGKGSLRYLTLKSFRSMLNFRLKHTSLHS